MNEQNYFLTIAIPTYNRAELLRRALKSVLDQPHDGVEIIVSDNASEDDTELVVKEHMPLGDIKYIKNPVNVGPDANFLQCFNAASGKFVLLLGSDDVMAEGGILKIKNFVDRHPDSSLIFLNYAGFDNEYKGLEHCGDAFLSVENEDIQTSDKKVFMAHARDQITYMSSLLISKAAFSRVENPQKYIGTNFIHSCLALEATKDECNLGIIFGVCVAKDYSHPGTLEDNFKIFGKCMHFVLCELAPQCGYDKRQTRKIYVRSVCPCWRAAILRLKCAGGKEWKKDYKEYGKPVLKKHPVAHIRLMPYLLMPSWFARCFFKIFHPVYQKIKGGKRK